MPDNHVEVITERQLLQSIVEVARHVYRAAASSVFMIDATTGELVFAAVAGAGEQRLVGSRFPAGTGIAGWVAASCQPIITDDVTETDQFAQDAATSTGYVPSSILAAPLVADGQCIGVLEILDRDTRSPDGSGRELADMELVGLMATQAALGLALLRQRGSSDQVSPDVDSLLDRLSELVAAGPVNPPVVRLLATSVELIARERRGS